MTEQVLQVTKTPREGRFLLVFASPLALLGTLAFLACWLAPNHYPPWTSFHGEAAAFAALLLFLLARLARPEPLVFRRAALVILALVPLIAVQWWAGLIPYGGDALVSILYVAGFALAWGLGASMSDVHEPDPSRWLATMVVAAAAISVLVAVLQWLRIEALFGIFAANESPELRPFGNLAQPNQLATLVLMGTVFAAGLYARDVLKGWHAAAIVAWLSFGLALTQSRSGLLGAALIGAFVLFKRGEAGKLARPRYVVGWWLVLLVCTLVLEPLNNLLYLAGSERPVAGGNGRIVMWHQILVGIAHSPWFGYGWRETIIAQREGAHFVSGWLATDYAHNIVLDVLAWVGVPLGLLLAGAALWWLVRAARHLHGTWQLTLYAALLPVVSHSLFEFPFAYSFFLFPAGYFLGALDVDQPSGESEPVSSRPASGRWRLFVFAAVAGWGILCSAVAREYVALEEDYRVMRFELRRIGTRPAGYEAPQVRFLTQLGEMIRAARIVARPGMPPAEIECLRIASNSFGWATLNLSYAVTLALNGRSDEATRQLQLAHQVYGDETYADLRRLFLQLPAVLPALGKVKVP